MLLIILLVVTAIFVAAKGNKKFIFFFMALNPVLPDYFAIELPGLPLLKASRILLLILIGFVVVNKRIINLRSEPFKNAGMYWGLVIYFAARILANAYYVPSVSEAVNAEFTVIFEQMILMITICQIDSSKYDVYQYVKTIVYTSGVLAVISIINVLIGENLFYNLRTISRSVLMTSTVRMGIVRAEATFGHPVYYAMYCALVMPLALYIWQNEEKKLIPGVILILNMIAMLLTESRGTIVVLMAAVLVVFFVTDKETRARMSFGAIVAALIMIIFTVMIPTVSGQFTNIIKSVFIAFGNSNEVIEDFGGNSSTGLNSRMIQLSGIVWMLMHNAIFGLGASCHMRGELSYYKEGIWFARNTIDNGYVAYLVEEGLLGGIACFSLFYSLIKSSWGRSFFHDYKNMNNAFLLSFLSYAAVMLSVADISQLLWVIISLFVLYNSSYDIEKNTQ